MQLKGLADRSGASTDSQKECLPQTVKRSAGLFFYTLFAWKLGHSLEKRLHLFVYVSMVVDLKAKNLTNGDVDGNC